MQSVGGDAEAKAPELSGAPRRLALLRSFAPALACIGRVVFDAPDGERGERETMYMQRSCVSTCLTCLRGLRVRLLRSFGVLRLWLLCYIVGSWVRKEYIYSTPVYIWWKTRYGCCARFRFSICLRRACLSCREMAWPSGACNKRVLGNRFAFKN